MKVYLSLIISLLLTTTYQVYSNGCSYVKIDYTVYPSTNCDNPNGLVFAKLSKNYTDYNFVWTDLTSNKQISTASRNYAYRLKAGDYKLTISPKDDPTCKMFKKFYIYGLVNNTRNKCYDDIDVNLESVTVTEISNGKFGINYEGLEGRLVWRKSSGMEKATDWDVVPKPAFPEISELYYLYQAVVDEYFFEEGKTYEFAGISGNYASNADKREAHVVSKPIRLYEIITNNNKTEIKTKYNFNVSPQPANDYINLKLASGIEANSIEILGLNGKFIKKKEFNGELANIRLNVSDLKSGIYILKVSTITEELVKKIIVK